MELQRGICSLCSESSKVLTSSNAEDVLKYLPQILYEKFLTDSEFQRIKNVLKICTICCYKLELARETRNIMNKTKSVCNNMKNECHFCRSIKYVIKVKDDWKYFTQRTEGFLQHGDFPVNICYRCVFYFDTIFTFKSKLLYKFPHLIVSTKSPHKQSDTPKRNSISESPQKSKRRKIFNNCFTYLQPLCNNNYNVDDKIKTDAKMYRKIAYVNLKDAKNVSKETPKIRPVIKIKLKRRSKKIEKAKSTSKALIETLQENNIVSQPYVKLCKSEEVSIKKKREMKNRHSLPLDQTKEESLEKLNETPKAASVTNLAPKRRVSLFVEPCDGDAESDPEVEPKSTSKPDSEPELKSESDPQLEHEVDQEPELRPEQQSQPEPCAEPEKLEDTPITPEEIDNIVEKYIKDTTFNDSNKLELLQEIEENNIGKCIEENGCEERTEEINEDVGSTIQESFGQKDETHTDLIQSEEMEDTLNEKPMSPLFLQEPLTPPKNSNTGEENDSDASDKNKVNSSIERDSLNGSERKKKRVTFSDEINE